MAFVIMGPSSEVVIESQEERLFYDLPRQLRLATPQCDLVWEAFYRNPTLGSGEQVRQFQAEIQAIQAAYRDVRKEELIREKSIRAKDPRVIDQILAPMLLADAILNKCSEIIQVCEEATVVGEGLACSSD